MESTSLLGREREYNEVHSFIEERLSLTHCKSLFVFGASGCGKTSTIHRAMRRVTHRPMAFDKAAAAAAKKNNNNNTININNNTNSNKSKGSRSSVGSIKEDNSPTTPAAKRQGVKRQREEEENNINNNNNNNNESGAAGNPVSLSLEGVFLDNTIEEASTTTLSPLVQRLGKQRRVQCHYVNCADMTAQQLCDAIINSFRTAQPRMDIHTRELLERIENLPKQVTASKRRQSNNNNNDNMNIINTIHMIDDNTSILSALGKKKGNTNSTTATPLHVIALDEVEYVRNAARGILTVLSALSVELSSQLALIFISNQRELVHVPHMLLKELPFEAYSVETLERIGARIVATADFTQSERQDIQLSSGLIAYIAKKAILEYSGDVRQVAAMCRRLVYTAQQDINSPTPNNNNNNNNYNNTNTNIITSTSTSTEETPRRYSTMSSNSNSGSTMAAGALNSPNNNNNDTSPPAAAQPNRNMNNTKTNTNTNKTNTTNTNKTTTVVTLAQSQKVLRGPAAVSDHVFTYIACMPEQMLYVLSCLVVLAQRQEKERHLAQSSVAGVVSSSTRRSTHNHISNSNSNMNSNNYINNNYMEPGTFTMRVVHRLYTALMTRRRFPAMTPAGIAAAIDGFADVGVLTRPQRRGGDDVFAFAAAWPTETLTRALTTRRDGAEHRVTEALQELAVIVGV